MNTTTPTFEQMIETLTASLTEYNAAMDDDEDKVDIKAINKAIKKTGAITVDRLARMTSEQLQQCKVPQAIAEEFVDQFGKKSEVPAPAAAASAQEPREVKVTVNHDKGPKPVSEMKTALELLEVLKGDRPLSDKQEAALALSKMDRLQERKLAVVSKTDKTLNHEVTPKYWKFGTPDAKSYGGCVLIEARLLYINDEKVEIDPYLLVRGKRVGLDGGKNDEMETDYNPVSLRRRALYVLVYRKGEEIAKKDVHEIIKDLSVPELTGTWKRLEREADEEELEALEKGLRNIPLAALQKDQMDYEDLKGLPPILVQILQVRVGSITRRWKQDVMALRHPYMANLHNVLARLYTSEEIRQLARRLEIEGSLVGSVSNHSGLVDDFLGAMRRMGDWELLLSLILQGRSKHMRDLEQFLEE